MSMQKKMCSDYWLCLEKNSNSNKVSDHAYLTFMDSVWLLMISLRTIQEGMKWELKG